jgi:hypothetical protein
MSPRQVGNTWDMSTMLRPGDQLPARSLPSVTGGPPVKIGFNQSHAQVLVVTHADPCEGCTRYLQSFEPVLESVRKENGRVFALVGPGWEDDVESLPVPAVEVDQATRNALSAADTPVVSVADRYGQLFKSFDAGDDHSFPDHDKILAKLLDIAIRCPECGVPDVPSPEFLPDEGTRSGGMVLGQ